MHRAWLACHVSTVYLLQVLPWSFFRRALHLLARLLSLGLVSGLVRSRLARRALRGRVPLNEGRYCSSVAERRGNPEVAGSIPASITNARIAQW
jgi:hypothetical protein